MSTKMWMLTFRPLLVKIILLFDDSEYSKAIFLKRYKNLYR